MMKVYGRVSFAVKRVKGLDFWTPPPLWEGKVKVTNVVHI